MKLSEGASEQTLDVIGRPFIRTPEWTSDSFSLLGFPVNPERPPNFSSFLRLHPLITKVRFLSLTHRVIGSRFPDPSSEKIHPGVAYWIYTTGVSEYEGPVSITLPQRTGLDYGATLTEHTVTFKNNSKSANMLRVSTVSSEFPPSEAVALAGAVPLSYFRSDLSDPLEPILDWVAPVRRSHIKRGEDGEWRLRFEVRRRDMVPFYAFPWEQRCSVPKPAKNNGCIGVRLLVPVGLGGPTAFICFGFGGKSRGLCAVI